MGWAHCGKDSKGRSIGYGVPAICDHPGCKTKIDRGLAYACGGMHGNETLGGHRDGDIEVCDEYFCEDHRRYNAVADTSVCFTCDVRLNNLRMHQGCGGEVDATNVCGACAAHLKFDDIVKAEDYYAEEDEDEDDEEVMWSCLMDALVLVRKLQPAFNGCGWHIALGGGLLNKGFSDHDLDLVVYPHNSNATDIDKLRAMLRAIGWSLFADVERIQAHWRKKGGTDKKHVEVWKTPDDKRVDLIFPHASTREQAGEDWQDDMRKKPRKK